MAGRVTRMLLVVVAALTLAVGTLGATDGFDPNAAAAVAIDGGDVTTRTSKR